MKLSKDDLSGIIELLNQAEDFRPIVKLAVKTLNDYAEDVKEIPENLSCWLVERRIQTVKQYEAAGFSRADAITMTLDDVFAVRRLNQGFIGLKEKQR